jgi:hypothetical protein
MIRSLAVAVLVAVSAASTFASSAWAQDIERSAVDFTPPTDIKWVRNTAATNESVVLCGDPGKPGPCVMRIKWLPGNMSRPPFHPDATVPAPAGSYVIHDANRVHYDGAKDEEAVIQVLGMGPATSTPAGPR